MTGGVERAKLAEWAGMERKGEVVEPRRGSESQAKRGDGDERRDTGDPRVRARAQPFRGGPWGGLESLPKEAWPRLTLPREGSKRRTPSREAFRREGRKRWRKTATRA